ncbi:hypothetical protein [Motiliproteus sp. MSK22-1]|uniref:hypothetical protein n=1 Tax=Motiliproteus sp. MSK22-1 TaxID=1897630 RepID=UPI000975846A|nr:hypothetical protein [Motiliproteus sp. MSK22-1]OMH33676.1 hypothetical protein BGP75_11760 [Motiliproteus sp. MSK22-1]
MSVKHLLTISIFYIFSGSANAHSLFLTCEQQDSQIHCTGGFSDGSSADDLPIEVISYEDEALFAGKTDKTSTFKFGVPHQDYYILLDAGPGHVVEVDMGDILQ